MDQSQSTQEEQENKQPQQVSSHSRSVQHTNTSPLIVSTPRSIREQHITETASDDTLQLIVSIPRIHRAAESEKNRKAVLQLELQSSPSDERRHHLEAELAHINIKIQVVEERQRLRVKSEFEQSRRKQESQHLFDGAMKDGHVLLRNINLLLMGAAGSGKSATKDLLLGNPPSGVRNSTPCRDRIAHVRPVTNLHFHSFESKWEEVSEHVLIKMLAKAIQHLPQSSRDKLPSDLQTRLRELASTSAATEANSTPLSQESVPPVQQAIKDVVTLVVEAMVSIPLQQEASISSTESKELFGTKTMRVTDNGGQPQFHDVAPLFIRHASAGLFVSRLTDDFADYPHDDLYKDGKPVGPSSPSHLSYLETDMSLLRSFLSCKRDRITPRPIFVGTFSDKIKDQKVIDKKNQALFDALPPELKEEVIYSNLPLKQVIFAVNACSRDENARMVANEIRKAVENSPTFDLKVPLWWFILELALQKLCKIMKRGILSKSECIALAQQLGFDPSALDAALDYFNDMCIVHYYPHILPHTVFVDPQVPLDKVSELTQHAVSLRDQRKPPSAKAAKWLKFRDQGIFTIDMLESEEFQKHYEDGLFTPADMIAIMMEFLIIAPLTIPLLGRVDCSFSQVEFLMPSLLRSVPPSELEDHRVFTSSADPLLIRFVSGCIQYGIFCCLVVFLIKKCGWLVRLPSGGPVLLARNCVKFRLPNSPCSVTLIDSFSYMEVHVKARPHVLPNVCPLVRASVLEGVDAASDALHYNNDKPVISIFCPHEGATRQGKRHFADIYVAKKLWCCSKDFDLDGDLKTSHTVWSDMEISPSDGSPFTFSIQPKDVCCKPGGKIEFTISTAPSATTYQWYYENQKISFPDYEGQTSKRLLVSNFLPKHKGAYWCVAGDGSGTQITSRHAALTAGEMIKESELNFIGNILKTSAIDFGKYGIDTVLLLNGESDVTYEEMEFVMNLNPRTQVLSINLKQEITSRLKEEQLYAQAIKEKVSLTYTKILALGPGQVGKSTFVRRLLGIMKGNILTSPPETQPQSSTGTSESREACIQYTRVIGAITNKKWRVLQHELHDQLSGLMSLIVKQSQHQQSSQQGPHHGTKIEIKESLDTAVPVKKDDTHYKTLSADNEGNESQALEMLPVTSTTVARVQINASQIALMPKESDIEKSIKEFEELKHKCSHRLDRMEFEMLFNIIDIGGQPAFLEMLPSLTIGPALYLVFMNLEQELGSRYPVLFKTKDQTTNICKNYSYTSEEVLFSALSSIACFGHPDEQVERYVQKSKSGDKEQKDSLAVLVGTFLDRVNDKDIKLTNKQIMKRLKDTAFYKEGLILSNSFSLLVNNESGDDSEIENHREKLERILTAKFRKYQIPTQWLMLSICLKLLARNQNKYHVSFNDCAKLGEYFDMDEDMVSVALQFLHKYIGLVMYFPHHENLKKIVICDPQVVFSTISELIFNIYDHNKLQVSEAQYDRFVETGCFSPQDITLISDREILVNAENKELLPINKLVDLLQYLNIAAKVPVSSGKEKVLYFLPAVLQTAETDIVKRKQKGENDELLPEPICIRFKTGYIPLGFVCALVANLTVEKEFNLLDESNKLYKNMIQFRFRGIFNVTVISLSRYCEFRVTRQLLDDDTEFWSEKGCPLIMKNVRTVSNKVIQSMQHGLRSVANDYEFAFHCPRHSDADFGQEPLAELVYDYSNQQIDKIIPDNAMCTKCKTTIHPLTPEMMFWFGKKPSTPLKICGQPSLKGNVISIRADGVRPLTYEWLLGGIKFCDGDDQGYDGYATNKLVIKDNDLLSEGVFKCQVKDGFGKCIESDELDLFEDELKRTWKLKKSEIRKLKKNGFSSIRELKNLQLNTLDFNMGEKERMKPLLASDQTKYDSSSASGELSAGTNEESKRNSTESTVMTPLSDEALLSSERSATPVQISSSVGVSDDSQVRIQKGTQDLMKQYCLTDEQLNSKIKHSNFPFLAKYFDGVTIYSNALGLTTAEQTDVNVLYQREGTQVAMIKCLSCWNQNNPYAATYKALLNLLLKLRKERIADEICQHLTQRCERCGHRLVAQVLNCTDHYF
ncbi:uncharacterized protein LOC135337779 isoform X2 [Halichondria panicea]|uniref:uncharacterized protein LOC135337779 isoform X2 n=1 Tax=Halichondria panicea TaxID=6063 RepID=UPI00312B2FBB